MLYVPFFFELCSSNAGGYISAVGIGPASAGTVTSCGSGLAEQHVGRFRRLLRGAAARTGIA
jgi:hypothetical protein